MTDMDWREEIEQRADAQAESGMMSSAAIIQRMMEAGQVEHVLLQQRVPHMENQHYNSKLC